MALKFICFTKTNYNNLIVESKWTSGIQNGVEVERNLIGLIFEHHFQSIALLDQQNGIHIESYTEYCREGIPFWAHLNYRLQGPWYDYPLIAWAVSKEYNCESDKDDMQDRINVPHDSINNSTLISTKLIPKKLVCFFKDEQGDTFAIIQSCLQQSKNVCFNISMGIRI